MCWPLVRLSFAKAQQVNKGLALLAVVFTIALAVAVDRIYGAIGMPETTNLLFPAFSRAHHQSTEFDVTVHINNLGFRGESVSIKKTKKRVVVLGDSFTFGWGVPLHETWIQLLQERYPDIEFLNLGQGGTHPGDYVQTARKVIPLLQPDLLLVGVLQGNDLHQLMRIIAHERGEFGAQLPPITQENSPGFDWKTYVQRLFPNFTKRWPPVVEIGERWQAESDAIRNAMLPPETKRYAAIDASIRQAFEAGQLNPSLLFDALTYPDGICAAVDTSIPLLQDATVRLGDYMKELRQLCETNQCGLIAVSLPNRPYGCPDCYPQLEALGYQLSNCYGKDADIPFLLATKRAHVQGITLPTAFTAQEYYALDGHWNASGNRIFAKTLSATLDSDSTWNFLLTSGTF
jgi:lysophospholipase L1-like esterase